MGLDAISNEIERMRLQIRRQRSEIQQLSRAGLPTTSAEALLVRMEEKVDGLAAERDRLVGDERRRYDSGKAIKGTPASRRA